MSIGEVPRAAARGLPGPRTSPRSASSRRGPGRAASARPSGYRKFSAPGRRAAALRPHRAARALPAAEGDPGAPRRDRPRARAAGAADDRPAGAAAWRWPRDGYPSAGGVRPDTLPSCGCPGASCSRPPRSTRSCSTQLETLRPGACRGPGSAPYDGDALVDRQDGRASSRRSASSRGTCARSRPPPTARSGWSSRSSRRSGAAARPAPQARAEEAIAQIAALSVRLHATLVKAGLRGLTLAAPRSPSGAGVGWLRARSRRGRCPGGDALQPAHRAAAGGGGGPLPADLDRRRRGDRDRLRPAGRRAAAAADPRPDEGPARAPPATTSPRSGSPR